MSATGYANMAQQERRRKTQLLLAQVMESTLKTLHIETRRHDQPVTINIEALVKEAGNIVDELIQKIEHEEEQEAAILRCVGVMQELLEKEILSK